MQRNSIAGLIAIGSLAALPTIAQAGDLIRGWERDSQVTDSVTDNGGVFSYDYTVINTSSRCDILSGNPFCELEFDGEVFLEPVIVDWELPWFDDAAITNIRSPLGWDYAIEEIGVVNPATGWDGVANWMDPGDPFYGLNDAFATVTKVLHWYVIDQNACFPEFIGANDAPVAPAAEPLCAGIISAFSTLNPADYHQDRLGGFGFDSIYDQTDAPYQASWLFLPVRTGDPAFPLGGFPNSPSLQGPPAQTPAPGPLALLGLGLIGLLMRRR